MSPRRCAYAPAYASAYAPAYTTRIRYRRRRSSATSPRRCAYAPAYTTRIRYRIRSDRDTAAQVISRVEGGGGTPRAIPLIFRVTGPELPAHTTVTIGALYAAKLGGEPRS